MDDVRAVSTLQSAHIAAPLRGRIALVVGGYGAIGKTVATSLAQAGANVVVAGRNAEKAARFEATARSQGLTVTGRAFDACDRVSVRVAVESILHDRGRLDILVNCLGHQREQSLLDVTDSELDDLLTLHVKPALYLAQFVGRHQIESGNGGRHVHLQSLRAFYGYQNRGYAAFCAAKGALLGLLRQQAAELGPHGITVNAVVPAAVLSEKNRDDPAGRQSLAEMAARTPLRRNATPEDVANAVLFLVSDAAAFISGHALFVDGGLSTSHFHPERPLP